MTGDVSLLQHYFGHSSFREGQREAIQCVQAKRDCVVIRATSSGKSLLYQYPSLVARDADPKAVTVVVSPLISLIKDQVDSLNRSFSLRRVDAGSVNRPSSSSSSSSSTNWRREVGESLVFVRGDQVSESGQQQQQQLESEIDYSPVACFLGSAQSDPEVEPAALRGEFVFVFITPEKLQCWLPQLQWLHRKFSITLFAVDEAHCISEHGHDFRSAYRSLHCLRESCPNVPILALTATATETVQRDILSSLRLDAASTKVLRSSNNRPNLFYEVFRKRGVSADVTTIKDCISRALSLSPAGNNGGGSAIVYVLTRKEAESLADSLNAAASGTEGFACAAYHATLPLERRRVVMDKFMSSQIACVVATVSFGMGINKSDVRTVVHYGMPRSLAAYCQETGRAGRDGHKSVCTLFFSDADIAQQHRFLKSRTGARRDAEENLAGIIRFAGPGAGCRRKLLLSAFGERCSAFAEERSAEDGPACVWKRPPTSSPRGLEDSVEPGCDVCSRGTAPCTKVSVEASDTAKLMLLAVAESRGYAGKSSQVNYLLGKRDKRTLKMLQYCRSREPAYGKGNIYPKAYWEQMHLELQNAGFIQRRIVPNGGYCVYDISRTGSIVMRTREHTVHLSVERDSLIYKMRAGATPPRPAPDQELRRGRKRKRPRQEPSQGAYTVLQFSDHDKLVYSRLRIERSRLAKTHDVPTFMVASDRTLRDLVVKKPRGEKELLAVHGFGDKKVQSYGATFLAAVEEMSPRENH